MTKKKKTVGRQVRLKQPSTILLEVKLSHGQQLDSTIKGCTMRCRRSVPRTLQTCTKSTRASVASMVCNRAKRRILDLRVGKCWTTFLTSTNQLKSNRQHGSLIVLSMKTRRPSQHLQGGKEYARLHVKACKLSTLWTSNTRVRYKASYTVCELHIISARCSVHTRISK